MARRQGRPGPGPGRAWLPRLAKAGLAHLTWWTFLIALVCPVSVVHAGKVTLRDGNINAFFLAPQQGLRTAVGAQIPGVILQYGFPAEAATPCPSQSTSMRI